ncbi:MAG: SpoIID/LytB domain-containing protein [Flavobacteriales bacterium]|nr:SpoIID/LytB domain-containing protein [Flavobacteriales bacterium]
MKQSLLFVLALAAFQAAAQDGVTERSMRIGLFRGRTTTQVLAMPARANCKVMADGVAKGELKPTDGLRIEVAGKQLTARSLSMSFTAKRIELVPVAGHGAIRLKAGNKNEVEREYPGRIEASVSGADLMLVNKVPLEAYTAGVVSAEAGKAHHQEYYKLQAVSCRTYALTNQRKHIADGFELCDGVHCQVYHGRNRNDSIRMAVESTRSLVIVDSEIKLIHATFHSNCGGETMNAEDLWTKHQPYLRAVRDTFCVGGKHAVWERTFSRSEWLGYFNRRFGFAAADSAQQRMLLEFEPQCRSVYFGNGWPLFPLKEIREDLKLKSTHFAVLSEGDQVRLVGRGFGHAVGLCQEGAMAMARAGLSYTDILHHYYTSVHLVDLGTLDFFRDDADPFRAIGRGGAGPRNH